MNIYILIKNMLNKDTEELLYEIEERIENIE